MNCLIEYLITTVGKTKQDIKDLLDKTNIEGKILVGNQCCEENNTYEIKTSKFTATIYNQTTKGVSLNRNFLLNHAKAEFVTFFDDDCSLINNQNIINVFIENNKNMKAVRFNSISENNQRKIKTIKKDGYASFRKLSSFGVLGIFFNRDFLIRNGLFFNTKIGPGTEINHGEDGVFVHNFLKKNRIYAKKEIMISAEQSNSTWINEKRNLEHELISHGYIYYLLYNRNAKFMSLLFLCSHMNCYPKKTKFLELLKYMKCGIKKAKEEKL